MNYVIEEIVELGDQVEVRARLEDGRLACVSLPRGADASYAVGVDAYIAEHLVEKAPNETTED